jgi:prephenate dehydrogenase
MFEDGLFCIATPPGVDNRAIPIAVDLIEKMGAKPLFVDLLEIDGLMAAIHTLPQLLSIALINTTINQPGWHEARKIAGRAFAEVSSPAGHLEDTEGLIASAKLNKDNITRKLDDTISVLSEMRSMIAQEALDELEDQVKNAKTGVSQWLDERGRGNWLAVELPSTEAAPTSAEVMGNLIGFGIGRRRSRRKDED